MLMNDFNKTFVFALCNFFLKIKLNCDKENMLISHTCIFQKRMLSNLTGVLIYLLCSENFVKLTKIYPRGSLLNEVTVLELPLFSQIFNKTNSANLDCQM